MDPIANKHKFGNFSTMPARESGFPLDQECLTMEQNNIRLLSVLASLSGYNYVILSGCGTSGARKPGYVYIKTSSEDLLGEILYYDGTAPSSNNLHIVEVDESVEANQVNYVNAYTERYLSGGASTSGENTLSWSSFKKLTIADLKTLVDAQVTQLSNTDKKADKALTGTSPIGSIVAYAGTTAPSGWLLCKGQTLQKSVYPDLANALGVTSSTFSLPNLSGRFLVGYNNANNKFDTIGKIGGAEGTILSDVNIPAHNHATTSTTVWGGLQGTGYPKDSADSTTEGAAHSYTRVTTNLRDKKTGYYGNLSPQAVPTLPPYYTVNYIIRAK